MIKKIILTGQSARAKLLKGALQVGAMVGVSLGPRGRNAAIQEKYKVPTITNDGVTIARFTYLPDEIEDLGAQTVIEGAMATNERVGDGTTTTVVIACKIVEEYAGKIEKEDNEKNLMMLPGGADVTAMAREILDTRDIVIEKLKQKSEKIKKGDLKNIVSSSIGKVFPEYCDSITDVIEQVGKDGYVSVDQNWNTKHGVETQVIKGMRFLGTYCTPYMVNARNKEAILEDVYVLITNHKFQTAQLLQPIITQLYAKGIRKLVVVAEGFERKFIDAVASSTVLSKQGKVGKTKDGRIIEPIEYLCIKAPSLTSEMFEDVSVFTDAKFIDKNLGLNIEKDVIFEHLGFVKKVVVNEDEVLMIGGRGNTEQRAKILQEQIDNEKDPSFKEQTKRRLGALQSGFAVIRVGAATDSEREFIKFKIEDAVYAAKAAQEEGIVKGGGLALKEIAEELGEKHPLYNSLMEPYNRIQNSAGGHLAIPKSVIDPVKVTRLAVENAFSVAASLITVEVAIADKRIGMWDELEKKIYPQVDVADDYRDSENQEHGFKT